MGESFRQRFENEDDAFIHPDDEDAVEDIDPLAMYKPGFWGTFALAVVLIIHALIWLGQGWSVKFDCYINYTACESLKEAEYVQVTPALHRGKAKIVPLFKEGNAFCFVFQRRKFVYDAEKGSFCKLNFKVTEQISFYTKAKDLSVEEAQRLKHQYGENKFEIPLPKFSDMYKQQLLSPIFCFQIFCVLLWALEDYWQYSLFTLALLFGSEATIVKTRLMTIQKLRGMGNRPFQVQVYRSKKWRWLSSEELVPGDILRLRYTGKTDNQPDPVPSTGGAPRPANKLVETIDESIVPCDCLIISGSAVVNEATLTGESVPQMKEAVEEEKRTLELKGLDKIHILFAGTKLLEVKEGKAMGSGHQEESNGEDTVESRVGRPPKSNDQGCLCYVVRTGFGSSQGKLVRRIEYSTETVASNRDPLYLILFLFIFALLAAGYVLKRGMEEKKRTHYQLLIHCILIITNVIPPDLPMQMAFAVNTSLVTLMQMMVFCIEPFRIPLAGQVQLCFFDKTGTITTDKLVAAGILQNRKNSKATSNSEEEYHLEPLTTATTEGQMVVAGCHSLVQVGGQLIGDPLESASFSAVNWAYNSKIQTAFMRPVSEPPKSETNETESSQTKSEPSATSESSSLSGAPEISLQIIHRHHFSSKLQRMSVIARVTRHTSSATENYVLVKGSPETIESLLSSKTNTKPDWYSSAYNFYTKKGMRVIALAYRKITSEEDLDASTHIQSHAEHELNFLGFIAFHCLVRKDSKEVIEELKVSGHRVIMVTGDAALTACHVASEVSVVSSDKSKVLRLVQQGISETGNNLQWLTMDNDEVKSDYYPNCVKELRDKGYDLCVTGDTLQAAQQTDEGISQHLHLIQVYSRMSPEQKENVLRIVKENKYVTLMCGDGTNDVGALKQADVGIALLSGFGDANSQAKEAPKPADPFSALLQGFPRPPAQGGQRTPTALDQIAWLNDPTVTPEVRKQRADMMKAREALTKDIEERKARGEWFATFKAIMSYAQKQVEEKQRAVQRGENVSSADPTTFALSALSTQIPPAATSASAVAAANSVTPSSPWDEVFQGSASTGELEMVKLGDASIAAPFTSKIPSIRSVTDIVRQGRCTLITTLQMYQILALNCLISAYSLSVLYLDGVKYSDANLIMMGVFNMISYLMISRGKPLPVLSHVRPPGSVFHPALFLSMIGQFIIHLSCLMFMTSLVKEVMEIDPRYSPSATPTVPTTTNWLSSKFAPSLMNTVVFLFSSIQQISVFAVNYKGRPFMQDITDNPSYMQSIILILVLIFVLASDYFHWLNDWLQLVRLPSVEFRNLLMLTIGVNVVGVIAWDRLVVKIFLPEVFEQMVKGLPERLWNLRTYFFGFIRMVAFVALFIYLTSDQELPEQ